MTAIEIVSIAVTGLGSLGGVIKYVENKHQKLHDEIHDLKEKIHALELESIRSDDNIKKHIHGCVNFKLKPGLENL